MPTDLKIRDKFCQDLNLSSFYQVKQCDPQYFEHNQ
jgi:hypothetical protein